MSFLKRLFGGGGDGNSQNDNFAGETREHEGYTIRPAPQKDGGQFRLCASITKEVDGEVKEHMLIRADLFASADEAVQAAIRKAHQVINEQGDRIFD